MVSTKLKGTILHFKPISDRMCYMGLQGKYQNLGLLNIHAPLEDKNRETKEQFLRQRVRKYSEI